MSSGHSDDPCLRPVFDISVKEEFDEGDCFDVTITETENDGLTTNKVILSEEIAVLSIDTEGKYPLGIGIPHEYYERTMTYGQVCGELLIPDTYDDLAKEKSDKREWIEWVPRWRSSNPTAPGVRSWSISRPIYYTEQDVPSWRLVVKCVGKGS